MPRAAGRMQLYACRSHLVNPADAVDGEFFNLDFLKDAGLLCAACFDCLNFCFHVILLSFCVAPFQDTLLYVSFIATAVPRNKTMICGVISSGSLSIHLTASQEVWRNGTHCNLRINPDRAFCVVNGNNVDFIYSFLNLCFAITLTIGYGNEVCIVFTC